MCCQFHVFLYFNFCFHIQAGLTRADEFSDDSLNSLTLPLSQCLWVHNPDMIHMTHQAIQITGILYHVKIFLLALHVSSTHNVPFNLFLL